MSNTLKVGAAKADITPSKKVLPIPFFMNITMDSVYNRLFVRVLDIDNGNERILFVTFDTTITPNPPETIKYICEVSGLDENHVFIAATHNHCAPVIGAADPNAKPDKKLEKLAAWYEEIKKAIKEAITQAAKRKQPAKLGFGKGKSFVNVNRDYEMDGKSFIGSNFERPSDKTLNVVKFEDLKGKPIAYLVNYAVHGVVMNGCLVDGKLKICSDLPGTVSEIIEDNFKNAVCLWTSGAAGDQNPRYMTQFETTPDEKKKEVKNLGETGYIVLEFLAKEHARDILNVEKNIVCTETEPVITLQKSAVSCEGRIPDSFKAFLKMMHKDIPDPQPVSYTLRLVTLGDLAIQGINGEVVTSIGVAVRSTSTFKNTILITHTDCYAGYIPDDWEFDHDAFEAQGSQVQKGAAQPAFVKTFTELFGNLK